MARQGPLGVWNETGIVDTLPAGGLPVSWRTPIHAGYAGPAVAGGRVFVTDSQRIKANAPSSARRARREHRQDPLDAGMGDQLHRPVLVYAIGPRATPTVDGDRVYVLGAMGHLLALDVSTGRVLWQKDYVKDFNASVPSWGMSGAPLVDGDRLICLVGGEPDAKVMALDKRTGEEIWRALSSDSEPGYNQPIIIEAGGARQLIIFHPDGFSSLDPATGKVYWEIEHRVQMGMSLPTPVQSGRYLFFTSQYGGARMLRLDETKPARHAAVERAGRAGPGMTRETPNTLNSVDQHAGDRRRLRLRPRQRRAAALPRGRDRQAGLGDDGVLKERAMYGTAFFVRNGDRYFINNDRGELI